MRLLFVIPTKNEEASIEAVIDSVRSEASRLGHSIVDILVVDDSRDQTREKVRQKGASVINGGGAGLGYAMWKGLKKASAVECDAIVTMDADGQSDISELERYLSPIQENETDLVLGSRFLKKGLIKYKYKFKNRFGVIILSRILRFITKLHLTDSHGGLRAMRPKVAQELEMFGTHSYVQETIIDAVEKGFRVKEVESVWNEREVGSSRVVSSIPLYICYILPVLIIRAKYHIKAFFTLGVIFIFLSFLDILYVLVDSGFSLQEIMDRQSAHLFLLLFLVGISMIFFGITLEFISRALRTINKTVDIDKL